MFEFTGTSVFQKSCLTGSWWTNQTLLLERIKGKVRRHMKVLVLVFWEQSIRKTWKNDRKNIQLLLFFVPSKLVSLHIHYDWSCFKARHVEERNLFWHVGKRSSGVSAVAGSVVCWPDLTIQTYSNTSWMPDDASMSLVFAKAFIFLIQKDLFSTYRLV